MTTPLPQPCGAKGTHFVLLVDSSSTDSTSNLVFSLDCLDEFVQQQSNWKPIPKPSQVQEDTHEPSPRLTICAFNNETLMFCENEDTDAVPLGDGSAMRTALISSSEKGSRDPFALTKALSAVIPKVDQILKDASDPNKEEEEGEVPTASVKKQNPDSQDSGQTQQPNPQTSEVLLSRPQVIFVVLSGSQDAQREGSQSEGQTDRLGEENSMFPSVSSLQSLIEARQSRGWVFLLFGLGINSREVSKTAHDLGLPLSSAFVAPNPQFALQAAGVAAAVIRNQNFLLCHFLTMHQTQMQKDPSLLPFKFPPFPSWSQLLTAFVAVTLAPQPESSPVVQSSHPGMQGPVPGSEVVDGEKEREEQKAEEESGTAEEAERQKSGGKGTAEGDHRVRDSFPSQTAGSRETTKLASLSDSTATVPSVSVSGSVLPSGLTGLSNLPPDPASGAVSISSPPVSSLNPDAAPFFCPEEKKGKGGTKESAGHLSAQARPFVPTHTASSSFSDRVFSAGPFPRFAGPSPAADAGPVFSARNAQREGAGPEGRGRPGNAPGFCPPPTDRCAEGCRTGGVSTSFLPDWRLCVSFLPDWRWCASFLRD
uniref:Uncharacterized protein n=1 Tax=Chromera velia CCMP2878 TaxID=1169474 RepID=A0A0G4HCQ7_9ALVE|eukprot:Cvel_26271.t1-p1 / transcript=Cvel_26271.t1 / gene=Cvel_26271 / organism=Chromera_velia_CCMP2878 / gene_product=hypothetical protein / transcript_product=hypothetical protein / location=Cvel_scaffold3100:7030-9176(-) / protein_length=593 / sequence_SO=supercontig / SO=protein_coding / is_pseudo=false